MKNLLIIAGTNCEVGKTALASKLIEEYSRVHKVTAIKIDPDFKSDCKLCISMLSEEDYIITEERSTTSESDSSRMLAAGADKVLSIQAKGKGLERCFAKLRTLLPKDSPIIIESDDLSELVKPGCLILLSGNKPIEYNQHLLGLADIHINAQEEIALQFKNGRWKF